MLLTLRPLKVYKATLFPEIETQEKGLNVRKEGKIYLTYLIVKYCIKNENIKKNWSFNDGCVHDCWNGIVR